MTSTLPSSLHQEQFSLRHDELLRVLSQTANLLIIQDLDGVCMQLVKDPLTRTIDPEYVEAAQMFEPHFYVLTNGEHTGERGVNGIVNRAMSNANPQAQGYYLPGLAAGGVQWQDRFGSISHPGVLEQELEFLQNIPQRIRTRLHYFFQHRSDALSENQLERCIDAAVLDNMASPTANLNAFYEQLVSQSHVYGHLQLEMQALMDELLAEAAQQGMSDSFFVHYAPNLGRDTCGQEVLRPATADDSGTTDFQFMLRGAVKEAGVVAILNHYYAQRTGDYPLGEDFSARSAPQTHEELLALVGDRFPRRDMPLIVGVGDTVNSTVTRDQGETNVRRGGSDRNFLQLVQDIGHSLDIGNIVVYVDSSGGEVLNRRPLQVEPLESSTSDSLARQRVIAGPGDPDDLDDPLCLNVVFPGGHVQYCELFKRAAQQRRISS